MIKRQQALDRRALLLCCKEEIMEYSQFREKGERVVESCSKVIVGKKEAIRLIFARSL